jgi:hypothetical protein
VEQVQVVKEIQVEQVSDRVLLMKEVAQAVAAQVRVAVAVLALQAALAVMDHQQVLAAHQLHTQAAVVAHAVMDKLQTMALADQAAAVQQTQALAIALQLPEQQTQAAVAAVVCQTLQLLQDQAVQV